MFFIASYHPIKRPHVCVNAPPPKKTLVKWSMK